MCEERLELNVPIKIKNAEINFNFDHLFCHIDTTIAEFLVPAPPPPHTTTGPDQTL
jgi:hypothetical protein